MPKAESILSNKENIKRFVGLASPAGMSILRFNQEFGNSKII